MSEEAVAEGAPPRPLRIAVLANFDSPHAWRWLKVFVERGHDVHAISYYRPRSELPGVTLHVLKPAGSERASTSSTGSAVAAAASRLPPSAMRLLNALRFKRAGLESVVREIEPDVLHGHYVVEHGFWGALIGFHPYIISAWGSDLLQAPRTPAGTFLARYALKRADFVSGNDPSLTRAAQRLGVPAEKLAIIRLGLEGEFLAGGSLSVNLAKNEGPPTVISDRALEPLYNIDVVLRAFTRVQERLPGARLLIANDGSQKSALEGLAERLGLGGSVQFLGHVDQGRLRELLNRSHVYVSVPSSDSLALSTMEAMACGALPIVSDLPSQDGWISHRVNGLRVPARDIDALAECLHLALTDSKLRREAVAPNHAKVESEGRLDRNMLVMERLYYRMAGWPLADELL